MGEGRRMATSGTRRICITPRTSRQAHGPSRIAMGRCVPHCCHGSVILAGSDKLYKLIMKCSCILRHSCDHYFTAPSYGGSCILQLQSLLSNNTQHYLEVAIHDHDFDSKRLEAFESTRLWFIFFRRLHLSLSQRKTL